MPNIALDLAGHKYQMLTVLERVSNVGKKVAWLCQCRCGKMCVATTSNLRAGQKSCGCYNGGRGKGGVSTSPLYARWKKMRERCYNSDHVAYPYYGSRGIGVCDKWKHDPVAFISWCKANGFKEGLWLDRIDNDRNYSPGNCRFVTPKDQAANKREYGSVKI